MLGVMICVMCKMCLWFKNLKRRNHWGNLYVVGKLIIKWILEE